MTKVKKRLTKELDKLWRAGKYWDWLERVQSADLATEFPSQWQEAWRSLSRQALRFPQHLEEFCQRLAATPSAPSLPDLLFIKELAAVLAGNPIPGHLGELSGLSPAAQHLRSRLLQWQPQPKAERKLERLARLCQEQPEKVTAKSYQDAAAAVQPNPLAALLTELGNAIKRLRQLNRKTGVSLWRLRQTEADWLTLDNELQVLSQELLPALRDVLLYPCGYQLWQCAKTAWEESRLEVLVCLTTFMPFLSGLAFGPHLQEVRQYAQQHASGGGMANELLKMLQNSLSQDWESKALALGKVRNFLREHESSLTDALWETFGRIYRALLQDLARLQPTLPEREKNALQRTLDRFLLEDYYLFLDEPEEEDILNVALQSGVGGVRMAILALWRQDLSLAPATLKQAHQRLQDQPFPGLEAIVHILKLPHCLPFPEIHRLKPVFQAYPEEAKMRQLIVKLFVSTLQKTMVLTADHLREDRNARRKKERQQLARLSMERFAADLQKLGDYPELQPLQELAACFPEGYFTPTGYERLLNRVLQRSPDLPTFLKQMDIYSLGGDEEDSIVNMLLLGRTSPLAEEMDELLFSFITRNRTLWKNITLEDLQEIAARHLYQGMKLDTAETNFLMHVLNILDLLMQDGNAEAAELHDFIFSIILENRRPGRSAGRRR